MKAVATMIVSVAAMAAVLGGCGGDDDEEEGSDTTAAAAATAPATDSVENTESAGTAPAGTEAAAGGEAPAIVIADFAFPEETTVAAGEPFTVRNDDGAAHTFTAVDGAFNVEIGAGETATIEGLDPGTYEYVCNFHGGMEGTLVVE